MKSETPSPKTPSMFTSVLDLFKIGIGPSSSHTMGPMIAANLFFKQIETYINKDQNDQEYRAKCTLKGSLAFTGKGHATDKAVALGMNNYTPEGLSSLKVDDLIKEIWDQTAIPITQSKKLLFSPTNDIVFDFGDALSEHPNGMIFQLLDSSDTPLVEQIFFSIGGGFIKTQDEIKEITAPIKSEPAIHSPFAFDSGALMIEMAEMSQLPIAEMKRANELEYISNEKLNKKLDAIWGNMKKCIQNGLTSEGSLPGGLNVQRRAKNLHQQLLKNPQEANMNDWLCAYAMAVNEENAAGHMVVTAPTNGAAGVIPAVLYYFMEHEKNKHTIKPEDITRNFLLSSSAIGGIIKHRSSISGAEVGCQGEVGSASSMAAAGLCAILGGTPKQIENAAEIALEHHLGMTCDPVKGLVQVPCIERNGFGAIKAYTAASLALRGSGQHIMHLDNCIAAMKQTGLEMSNKFKETSLGGLAVSITEC